VVATYGFLNWCRIEADLSSAFQVAINDTTIITETSNSLTYIPNTLGDNHVPLGNESTTGIRKIKRIRKKITVFVRLNRTS
jgi:hypothetical protein